MMQERFLDLGGYAERVRFSIRKRGQTKNLEHFNDLLNHGCTPAALPHFRQKCGPKSCYDPTINIGTRDKFEP